MKRVGDKWLADQRGSVNPLLVATILLSVLLVVAAGGFIWAYMEMTDWRNNGQAKIDAAVAEAKDQQYKDDEAHFNEEEKKPNRVYQGPADMGSVRFNYPKTWAGYVAKSDNNGLEVYFNPLLVSTVNAGVTPYALRVQVTNDAYSDVLEDYQSLVEDGVATASTIILGKTDDFAGYEGVRVDGQLTDTINGSVVIFKVRDKTLRIYVDSQDYMNDFNETILKSLRFEP